jgi:hypothetical protein
VCVNIVNVVVDQAIRNKLGTHEEHIRNTYLENVVRTK